MENAGNFMARWRNHWREFQWQTQRYLRAYYRNYATREITQANAAEQLQRLAGRWPDDTRLQKLEACRVDLQRTAINDDEPNKMFERRVYIEDIGRAHV